MFKSLVYLLASVHPAFAAVVKSTAASPKQAITPALFSNLVYYANYSADYAVAPCKNPPHGSVIQGYANSNTTDTQMTLFRSDARKELILTFPGTASLQDFLTDFVFLQAAYATAHGCSLCAVHSGFLHAWTSVKSDSLKVLNQAIKAYPSYKIVIAGHSLGGAIAQLAYADLKSSNYNLKAAYTFGQPRVGNRNFADFVDRLSGASTSTVGNFLRVTHANDGVPLLPPTLFGFEHSGAEIWETDGPGGAAPTASTTYRCYGHEATDCVASAGGFFINAAHLSYVGFNYTGCN